MEYKYPDQKKLQLEYLKIFGEEFLKLNNLNIGDKVLLNFSYESIHTKYNSRELQKFTNYKESEGILKLDNDGVLYAESIEDANFYVSKSNGFSGRSYKSWYELKKKKSIVKFGTGFIL